MMTIAFKGNHFERDVILWGVRWYVAYPLSYRQIGEMMEERGVEVDHSTLNRWVLKYVPVLEKAFLARKRPVGGSWRLDETYVRVKGAWKYLYRAVDKAGATVDFLLTARRDRKAALRFLRKAIDRHGVPGTITIDKSGANTAAIASYNADHDADVEIRQVKYLNSIVEQDHRAIKRLVRPMLGFKAFWSAAITLAGIEIMHMIPKISCVRRETCVQRSNSIRWQGKPDHLPEPWSSTRKVCDRTRCRAATAFQQPARLAEIHSPWLCASPMQLAQASPLGSIQTRCSGLLPARQRERCGRQQQNRRRHHLSFATSRTSFACRLSPTGMRLSVEFSGK